MRFLLNRKIVALAVILVSLVVFANIYQSSIRNFFYLVSEPIQKPLRFTGQRITNFLRAIVFSKKNQQENQELRLLIQELLAKTGNLAELEAENKTLREALEIGLRKDFTLVLAQVTGKDVAQDSLIINKGAKDLIQNNLPVITQQKVLVGKITEVFENFSRVQLISNKNSSFDGRVLGSEVPGLVKGSGNLKISFDLVPQYEEVKEGELLTTTALGGIFPAGLLVGQVKSVKKSDIEPFQQIEIQSSFDIKQLDYLFIISSF